MKHLVLQSVIRSESQTRIPDIIDWSWKKNDDQILIVFSTNVTDTTGILYYSSIVVYMLRL